MQLIKNKYLENPVLMTLIFTFIQISEKLYGMSLDITVDWNTMESGHDAFTANYLLEALAGETEVGALAGLSTVVDNCSMVLQDIQTYYNIDTVKVESTSFYTFVSFSGIIYQMSLQNEDIYKIVNFI